MAKKKILFVISKPGLGGAQTFLKLLTERLNLNKFEFITMASRGFLEIRKNIMSYRPDVLFLMSTEAGFLGTLAAIGTGVRVIYRIGGWSFNDPKPWWRPVMKYVERFMAGWRDIIIVNNLHDFEQASKLGIKPKDKLALIHNGIDPFKLKLLPRGQAREELGLSPNDFVVGTIARKDSTKGLEYLEKLPAKNYKLKTLSNMPDASQYLSAFDVFVSASLKEGFSWSILEAMAAKVPVIATRVGAAPEMIEDGVSGFLVDPRDAKAIEEKLEILSNDESLRQKFAIHAHQNVLKKFDINKMVEEISNLFN